MTETTTDPATTKSFRVLIVDDSQSDTELTVAQLSAAWPFERDMSVDSAADGVQALDMLRRERFALLILDWQMPVMGGAEVLRHLRRHGVRIPVVVVSGLERHHINEDLEAHAAAYLNKNKLTTEAFYAAIAHSLRLLGRTPPTKLK